MQRSANSRCAWLGAMPRMNQPPVVDATRSRARRNRDTVGGSTESRHAAGRPGDGLHAGMTVRVPQRIALDLLVVARVVDHQVGPAVLGQREAVVPGTEDVLLLAGSEDRLARLGPARWLEQVGRLVCM